MCTTFSNLVFRLSRMLKREDLEAISYLYRLPVDTSTGSSATGLWYLKELEKSDIFSSSNLEGLREFLKTIQRCDLLDIVEEYKRERQNSTRHHQCQRPQEESIRLSTSYAQAKKTEEELASFQKELIAFCSRYSGSLDIRQFYTGMLKRLKEIKEDIHQYTTVPLSEIINKSYLTPTKFAKQSQGGRQCQSYESHNRHQSGVTVVTDGPGSIPSSTHSGQRRQEQRIATQGQASHSQQTQVTPPLSARGILAVTKNPLPRAHSTPNGPESHTDVDYDMLSPIETMANETCSHSANNMPHAQREQSSACNKFAVSGRATSRSTEALTTVHCESRPPKLSTTRKNMTGGHSQSTAGKQQNNGPRSPSGHGHCRTKSSNSGSIPMKRINSVDDLLSQNKPNTCGPSRIPILTNSPKHQRHQFMQVQSSSRDSSDLSGGSFSECDFTGSVDSGIDVREFSRARFGRNSGHGSLPGSDLSPPLIGRSHAEKDYARLSKSTMEASSIYQKPQAQVPSNH